VLLTVDVGNTNTVLGVFKGDELVRSWRVKTDPRSTADELWLQYRSLVDGYESLGYQCVQQCQRLCVSFAR
jgi:type III pantothenate kinase